jgi:tetratricopeptide (TPR) repeat protein
MQKKLLLLLLVVFGLNSSAQEIERSSSNLPIISDIKATLDNATGWVLQDDGNWLSASNKILLYNSERNRYADALQKLGRQNFDQLELREVLIGDEQYVVLIIRYKAGSFEFPALRQNFHKTENVRYVVFPAEKLEEIKKAANSFNQPTAINLEVYCSDNIIGYDKKQLITQIAFNILRVTKMKEPSKFTMILALMPVIVNGEKLFRFRYLTLFNQKSIYKQYLLPANKGRHFERNYFEVPYQTLVDFFGSIHTYQSDFDILNPKTFQDFYKRGLLRYTRNNFQGALEDLRSALKQKPDTDFWLIYALMGSTQHQLGNYSAAIRSFDKAILLKPSDKKQMKAWVKNYYNRGLSYLLLDKKEEACADFQEAKSRGISDEDALKVIKKNCKKIK